jgi:transketolase
MIRPADANEAIEAWELALSRQDGPVALALSRQGVPTLEHVKGGVSRGGYIVREGDDLTLIGTGSEVATCLGAADILAADGISARVVSLPCWELFFEQPVEYRNDVLGSAPRVSVEAGATFGWERIVGQDGLSIGIDHFGASAPAEVLGDRYGFTAESVADRSRRLIG